MMSTTQVAIYARVSSEQQVEAHTIESQLEALRERVAADGLALIDQLQFIDEGYSGATLVRPALERLRDLVATGTVDRIYVHSPDRLARNYAYQVLLIDEFQRAGVEVIFLNRELGRTPEDNLLLQIQGIMAEYERAKIMERNRRGKLHAARAGSVNVLVGAPYGYRYITKHDGGGQARYEIVVKEAWVVRQIFKWVGRERVSIGEVCRRLNRAEEPTRTGKMTWRPCTVSAMLKNPAYIGVAAFGKTRQEPLRPRLRARRGHPLQPRRAFSRMNAPKEDWISIPVPAIVETEIFVAVQEQLRENQQRARQGHRGAKYLLQGLLCCSNCGYALSGNRVRQQTAKGKPREYAYYRCLGRAGYFCGGERVCSNQHVRTDLLDQAVWREVRKLLEHPQRVAEEYRRRLQPQVNTRYNDRTMLETQLGKLRQGMVRLIDSYAEGLIEKQEFEPRISRMRERIKKLEEQIQHLADEALVETELQLIVGKLEDFASKVKEGLDGVDWTSRREIIRALVQRVEVDERQVVIVFRIDQHPFDPSSKEKFLEHCISSTDIPCRKEPGSRRHASCRR